MNPRPVLLALSFTFVAPAPAPAGGAPRGPRVQPIGAGAELDAVDEGGVHVRLRIDGIEIDPKDPDHDTLLYAVSARDPAGTWVNYCTPGPDGLARAIPVAGSWDATGAWHDDGAITMACTSGAVAKCIRFGYQPWKRRNGISLHDTHQACTRMVRADYCGDGRTHTRNGTWIDMYDLMGIQPGDPEDAQPRRFEAAWGPGGATYLHHPRWSDDAGAVAQECPARLAGRTGAALPEIEIARRWPETLLFNRHYVSAADRMAGPPHSGR